MFTNLDLVIIKLIGKNVYAPNDHNEEYFDSLKDMLEK